MSYFPKTSCGVCRRSTFQHAASRVVTRLGISALGAVAILLVSIRPASAIVKTYHHGVDGYAGARDTYIRSKVDDFDRTNANFNGNGSFSSGATNPDDFDFLIFGEQVGLVRFEDLGIPAGSVINSATLSLYKIEESFGYEDYNSSGSNSMSVSGMLLPWEPGLGSIGQVNNVVAGVEGGPTGVHRLRPDSADSSTWVPWNELLARAESPDYSASSYDSVFDHGPIVDTITDILQTDLGYYDFDVTSTFTSQFALDKMYGWLIGETLTGGPFNSDGLIAWRDSEYNGSNLDPPFFTGYHAPVLTVDFTPGTTPGDFDTDGDVDGADYLFWQRGGISSPPEASDLALWQSNFNGGNLLASAAGVPEPASGILLLLGGMLCAGMHRLRS